MIRPMTDQGRRRAEIERPVSEQDNADEWLAWLKRHGLPDLPLPTWIEVDDDAQSITYLAAHGNDPDSKNWHLDYECPDNPRERGADFGWCTEEVIIRRAEPVGAFPLISASR